MSPVLTKHRPQPVRSLARVVGPIVLATLVAALFALLLDFVAPAATVDRVILENRAGTQVEVGVRSDADRRVLWLATVDPGSTAVVEDVLDRDGTWVVRGEHAGRRIGEVRVGRDELEGRGWRFVIPARWGQAQAAAGT